MLRKQKRKDGECVMSCIAIKNATIVTVNERNEVIYDGTVIFENDRIKYVGKTKNAGELLKNVDEIIDGNGKILTPGIVNVHTHVMGNVFRGMTEDGPYDFIYRKCFPMESYLNEENAYWLSMNGCIETLKFGSVLINDLFHFASQTARAVDQIGMRAILEHKVYDVKSLANVQNMDYSRNYEAGKKRLEENEKLICDWNGKANTASIISKSTSAAVTNTAAYAPGFCNLYSRVNANGKGLTAGKWWLPSVGEMMMIYANMTKINYCLSLISGAAQLVENWYWTSTEYSAANAWGLHLSSGTLFNWNTKASNKGRVRPVSAFIS